MPPQTGLCLGEHGASHRPVTWLIQSQEHGIIGDDPNTGAAYVSCKTDLLWHAYTVLSMTVGPLHKRNWDMKSGDCLNDDQYSILAFEAKAEGDDILLLLPESDELDTVIGSSKWMVRQATAELYDRGSGGGVEIVGPDGKDVAEGAGGSSCSSGAQPAEPVSSCGNNKLEW